MAEGTRGGRGKCRACSSPHQDAINQALVGRVSYTTLEKQYGITRSALFHHKANHLSPALIALTKQKRLEGSARSIVDQVEDLLAEVRSMYDAARRSRNFQQALAALGKLLAALELQARITGELDERPQVTINVQQTRQWVDVRTVIFEELRSYPEVGRRIAARLRVLEGGAS